MKRLLVSLIQLFLLPACFATAPASKDDFFAAVRAAFEAKDYKRVHQLTWEKGASDVDTKEYDQCMHEWFGYPANLGNISIGPLTESCIQPGIGNGRRSEFTYPPAGVVKIVFNSNRKPGASVWMGLPYAVINGGYYLVWAKSWDIGWKGPQDKPLRVTVDGMGADNVKGHIKYNVSGVDKEADTPRGDFNGQYISEVTIESTGDNVDVVLRILDGKKIIYESAPLKGKGQIVYKKGDQSPQ
jgi:hypothetical protein